MSSQLTAVETGALAGAQSGGFQSHAATDFLTRDGPGGSQ